MNLPKNVYILNDGHDREEWLDSRTPFITATQAAAIVGSHPYSKQIDVWNEKTDPDHQREEMRNRWLEERAAFGTASEPEIIEWANQKPDHGPGAFTPNAALLTTSEHLLNYPTFPPAATPDACKVNDRGALILLECKATESDWRANGLPQHIYDQVLWQMMATGAVVVYLAVRQVKWVGRGKNKTPEIVDHYMIPVYQDEARLRFLLDRVTEFRHLIQEGIAPESDIDLRTLAAIEFDAPKEEYEAAVEASHLDVLMSELDELEAKIEDDTRRVAAIKAELGAVAREYVGRRVWLHGTRRIVKLVRFWKVEQDVSALPAETRRAITSWKESSRVVIEPNPDWTAPAVQD